MIETIPIQARKNLALTPSRAFKAAYGPFCDAIRRLGCLTPTQKDVARFIAFVTLRQGFGSLAFASLSELTQVRMHARPFAGLGKNDLSPALVALGRLGVVKVDAREGLETGMPPVSILTIIADARQWAVREGDWAFTVAEETELLNHLLACRRRWTVQFPELAEGADLLDARAALAAESVAEDALELAPASACGAAVGLPTKDARTFAPAGQGAPRVRWRSEIRNAETPEKAGCVPTFGTAVKQLNGLKQRTVQQLNSIGHDDSNRLLAMLEVEFARVHGAEQARVEMINSGGCWRRIARRWPGEFESQIGGLRSFLNEGGHIRQTAWSYVQFYMARSLGCANWQAVCEKSKESLSTDPKAR